ncbi:MAG: chorismate-binding protein [Flavobacteriaceae bacterium]|nr:chorismate-binding protein [Flavobacteriaceae bacterium]
MKFSSFITQLKEHHAKELPFVAYHKPNHSKINALLDQNAEQSPVDYTQKGFVMSAFQGEDLTHFIQLENAVQLAVDYAVNDLTFKTTHASTQYSDQEALNYQNQISNCIEHIQNTEVQKIVFSRKVEITSSQDPFQAFKNLLYLYPEAFCYIWHHPKLGTWLGATPETLFHLQRNQLKTMALAGTQLDNEEKEVSWGAKEREEQALVTQAIVEGLRKHTQQVKQGPVSTKKAGKLLHLHTPISAQIELLDLPKIIHEIHPTPAVAGLPKQEAVAYLLANENYQRKYYTGFLGEVHIPQQVDVRKHRKNQEFQAVQPRIPLTDLYVNLRCMEFTGETYQLYVGGGITEASNPKLEWEETQNKLQTMLNVL